MAEEKYTLIKLLGRGGFGSVWLAHTIQTGEQVALKIMHMPQDASNDPKNKEAYERYLRETQKAHERFLREVQISKLLDHPHVLRALDSGYMEHDGYRLPYFVSPYIKDGSLADVVKKMPPWEHWTLAQTVDVIVQAAEGLEYMHTRDPKIIHQDVKPGNFLLRWEKEKGPDRIVHIFLCDFGISRWQVSAFDKASQILGTHGYLAPEQLYGNITWTADLYSLAVVAYFLLTGKMPVRASDDGSMFLPPSQVNPLRVQSDKIDEVILKALELDPKQRFPSVLAFAQALQYAITLPISPYDARTEKGAGAQPPPSPPPVVPDIVDQQFPPIPLYPKSVEQTIPAKTPPLSQQAPLMKKIESTSLPEYPLNEVLRRELPELPRMLCWSKDGNYVVCTFFREAPRVIGSDDSFRTLGTLGSVRAACWSPEGHILAVSSQNSAQGKEQSVVRLLDVDAPGERPITLLSRPHIINNLDWSKQGQLAIWMESHICIYALPRSISTISPSLVPQTLSRQDMQGGRIGVLRWSPDGSLLAAGASNGTVVCWRANTQRVQWEVPASGQLVYSIAWSPDSTLLAVAFSNRRVVLWDVQKKQMLVEWQKLPIVPNMLSISAQQRMVIASDTGDLLFGHLSDPAPTATHPGYWLAAWSPVHSLLATLDAQDEKTLIIWEE